MVNFEDSFEHATRQDLQHQKEQKNVKEDDILAGQRALMRDHERGIGSSTDDFGSVAQAMVSNSASGNTKGDQGPHISGFQGSGIFLPDVAQLQDRIVADKQEKAEAKEAKKKGKKSDEAAEGQEGQDDAEREATSQQKQGQTSSKPATKSLSSKCVFAMTGCEPSHMS